MARNWQELSDGYRHRLERGGISRNDYESGASLSAARGHGLSREQLIDYIQARKIELHGDNRRFNAKRSRKNIGQDTETGQKRTVSELKKIARAYDQSGSSYSSLMHILTDAELDDADKYH